MTEERALTIARERYGSDVEFVRGNDCYKIYSPKTKENYGVGRTFVEALSNANKRDRWKKHIADVLFVRRVIEASLTIRRT
jgi:hypothetical protein